MSLESSIVNLVLRFQFKRAAKRGLNVNAARAKAGWLGSTRHYPKMSCTFRRLPKPLGGLLRSGVAKSTAVGMHRGLLSWGRLYFLRT